MVSFDQLELVCIAGYFLNFSFSNEHLIRNLFEWQMQNIGYSPNLTCPDSCSNSYLYLMREAQVI